MHLMQKYILELVFSLRLVLNLFLIFHQISGSCSYNIPINEESVPRVLEARL